ncbi:MAG TPA: Crp/Fnr family transcriptional regulator [Gemmatimonadaceae bacterium]|jgi:CRP/FNR family transcriptional regulator|nr:Crp/Fnr family transcriptional regulator [Gemmatimonadaceae bacterium]
MDDSVAEARSVLGQIPLFASFGDLALDRLSSRSVARAYPAGTVLFTTGERCRGLYVVIAGRVRIYRTSPTGREQVLKLEGPGRPVAELPLFDDGPYPASAVAQEDSRLLFVPRDEFEALYREHPEVALAVIRNLGSRLRHLVHLTETLAFRDVAARLAHYLVEYAGEHARQTPNGLEFVLPRTQEELSFELGTARESVSRAFKQLSEKGVIVVLPRRRIRIPDLAKLRAFGRPGGRPQFG